MGDYCSIYVSGFSTIEEIKVFAFNFGEVKIDTNSFVFGEVEFYIEENDDFDNTLQCEFPDGFLYFPFIFEMDFHSQLTEYEAAAIVNKCLQRPVGRSKASCCCL